MRNLGFLIVQKPEFFISAYEATEFARENAQRLHALRKAAEFVDPLTYRGISRDPIWPAIEVDPKSEEGFGQAAARRRFRELIGPSAAEIQDENILSSLTDAEGIRTLLDHPEQYELVYVERNHFTNQHELLGYDVGYWGGDHFSLIADTVIAPQWHPPDEDKFVEVADQLKCLNEHALFQTHRDAQSFREYYKGQDWAETEFNNEFEIIRVAVIKTQPNSP
jgi:hypothetical protein